MDLLINHAFFFVGALVTWLVLRLSGAEAYFEQMGARQGRKFAKWLERKNAG